MTQILMQHKCEDFASALAARESVPGGGAAAAYAGALSAALASMVANFTVGKQAYAEYDADIKRILDEAAVIRTRFIELVDEDAENFAPLACAYALSKDDPSREETLEACTHVATTAPLEMVRQASKVVELAEELLEKGSRMLVSDVGCASALARASLEASALNVFVNTKCLCNRERASEIDEECKRLLAEYIPRAQAVTDAVFSGMRS